jgi:uncharacterized delta-60 repeat protein
LLRSARNDNQNSFFSASCQGVERMNRKKTVFGLIILMFFAVLPLFSPSQSHAWARRYDGPSNAQDAASDIAVDGWGNVYVIGFITGSGGANYATIKYDTNGNRLWVRTYNGPGNGGDKAQAIAVDGSGNVYVTGQSTGSGGSLDYATIKYDTNGNRLWVRRYNPYGGDDSAVDIAVDSAGNVYVTGQSYSATSLEDYATIKYSPTGNRLWVRRYDSSANFKDSATAVAVDAAGNVFVTGFSFDNPYYDDYATVKYSTGGDKLWVKRYNGGKGDRAYAIAADGTGGVYVTGASSSGGFDTDYATIKYSPSGDQQWARRYSGPGAELNRLDAATAIAVDPSGNVCVTGYSYGTDYDYATIKYSPDGTQQWVQRYDGTGCYDDAASAIAVDGAGNIYVTGYSYGSGSLMDYLTIKYSPAGASTWSRRYNGPGNWYDDASAIAVDSAGRVYVTGGSDGASLTPDFLTIKYFP